MLLGDTTYRRRNVVRQATDQRRGMLVDNQVFGSGRGLFRVLGIVGQHDRQLGAAEPVEPLARAHQYLEPVMLAVDYVERSGDRVAGIEAGASGRIDAADDDRRRRGSCRLGGSRRRHRVRCMGKRGDQKQCSERCWDYPQPTLRRKEGNAGAIDGDRTRDNRYHKPALYQLSYDRHSRAAV